jgi:transcriptional regulator of acetoin/glycerol metabolism
MSRARRVRRADERRGPRSGAGARAELLGRLDERRGEIESALRARVYAVADPGEVEDPAYAEGLRAAIAAALAYALAGLEAADPEPGPVPAELLAQARHAARARITLDTVLRRYVAGHTLIGDHLAQAAEEAGLPPRELRRLLGVQAELLDRLLAAVSLEHRRQAEQRRSPERRRSEAVRRLLAGGAPQAGELAYELDAHHLGAAAAGPDAEEALRALARRLDRRLLAVPAGEETWAWLGGTRALGEEALAEALAAARGSAQPGGALALGEPAQGLGGWRLTHRQAAAALPVARRGPEPALRYRDVALLAAALGDELLATSLRRLYLERLEGERDGGEALRETLRAYFAAGRNVSSAASRLGLNRHTVADRLRAVEERLGRPLDLRAADLEVALRLSELGVAASLASDPPDP